MADINITLSDDEPQIATTVEKIDTLSHAAKHESGGNDTLELSNIPLTAALDLDGQDLVDDGTTLYDSSTGTFDAGTFDSITLNAGDGISGGGSVSPGGALTFDVAANGIQLRELDESIAPTWTSNHIFNGGLELGSTLDASGNSLINLPEPTADSHATRKQYVDAVAQGLAIKDPVEAATASDIDLSSSSDPNPIDGHSLVDGERVLLRAQSDNTQNGIYVATTATDPTTWTRASDFDESAEVTEGAFVFVENGSTNGNASFVLTSDDPHTIGSSAITFSVFSRAGDLQAGVGLDKVGQTFSVDQSFAPTWTGQHTFNNGVSFSGGEISIDSSKLTIADGSDGSKIVEFQQGTGVGMVYRDSVFSLGGGQLSALSAINSDTFDIKGSGNTIAEFDSANEKIRVLAPFETGGGGSDSITIRDSANSQDLAVFNEGGPVTIPQDGSENVPSLAVGGSDSGFSVTGGRRDMHIITKGAERMEISSNGISAKVPISVTNITSVDSIGGGNDGLVIDAVDTQGAQRSLDLRAFTDSLSNETAMSVVGSDSVSEPFVQFATSDIRFDTSNPELKTAGGGADSITIRDSANSQDIAVFNEGGEVNIPNGSITAESLRVSTRDILSLPDSPDNDGFGNKRYFLNGGTSSHVFSFSAGGSNNDSAVTADIFSASGGGDTLGLNGYTSAYNISEDAGAVSAMNMGVTSTPTAGTEQSYSFDIDGSTFATVYAEADGAGGLDGGTFVLGPSTTQKGNFNNTPLSVAGNILMDTRIASTPSLVTAGSGSDGISVYDQANSQDLVVFNEGGPVSFPNTGLEVANNRYNFPVVGGGGAIMEFNDVAGGRGLTGIIFQKGSINQFTLLQDTDTSSIKIQDNLNSDQTVIEMFNGGNVEIPNGGLAMSDSLGVIPSAGEIGIPSTGELYFDNNAVQIGRDLVGGGSWLDLQGFGGVRLYDKQNAQDILLANAGGNVEIPNGSLALGTSQDFSIENDESSSELLISDSNGVELIRQPKAGATQFLQGIDAGSIEAPEDSFTQLVNSSVTSALTAGQRVGYTFALDNQTMMSVEGEADGSGGIQNTSVDLQGTTLEGLRSSSTALASGDLANGEVAMDEANGRMVWKDDSGSAYYVDGTAL